MTNTGRDVVTVSPPARHQLRYKVALDHTVEVTPQPRPLLDVEVAPPSGSAPLKPPITITQPEDAAHPGFPRVTPLNLMGALAHSVYPSPGVLADLVDFWLPNSPWGDTGTEWGAARIYLGIDSSGRLHFRQNALPVPDAANGAQVYTGASWTLDYSGGPRFMCGPGMYYISLHVQDGYGDFVTLYPDSYGSLAFRTGMMSSPTQFGGVRFMAAAYLSPVLAEITPEGRLVSNTGVRVVNKNGPDGADVPIEAGGGLTWNGDVWLRLFRGASENEWIRLLAAAGGSTGLNNLYTIDRHAPSVPATRDLVWRTSSDDGATWHEDLRLDFQGNLFTKNIGLRTNPQGAAYPPSIGTDGSSIYITPDNGGAVIFRTNGAYSNAGIPWFPAGGGIDVLVPTGERPAVKLRGEGVLSTIRAPDVGQTTDYWEILDGPGNRVAYIDAEGTAGFIALTAGVAAADMMRLRDLGADPAPPSWAGGVLYTKAGALCYRGSAGTVTEIAPA